MALMAAAAVAALVREYLRDPERSYAIGKTIYQIARSGGAGSQLAKAAVQGFVRGGIDEVEQVFARAAQSLQGQYLPLLRRIEWGMQNANGMGIMRSYGTAEEGFSDAIYYDRVASLRTVLADLNPYVAALLAGTAVFEAEHHRHGAMHDMHHPIDAITDVTHAMEGAVERFIDKFERVFTGKRKTPEPDSTPGVVDDFSGIQYTFYDPPTGRIMNYKGIRRFGRRFSKQSMGKFDRSYQYDLDSARPVSRIRPE